MSTMAWKRTAGPLLRYDTVDEQGTYHAFVLVITGASFALHQLRREYERNERNEASEQSSSLLFASNA